MSGQNASEIWMDVCSLSRHMDPAIILAICTIQSSLYYYSGLCIYRGAHYCVTGDIYVLSGQNYVWTPDGHDLFSRTMHLAIILSIFQSSFFRCSRPLSRRKYIQNPDKHYPCSGTIYLAINLEIVWSYFIWCSRPFSGQNYIWHPEGHDLYSRTLHLAIILDICQSLFLQFS